MKKKEKKSSKEKGKKEIKVKESELEKEIEKSEEENKEEEEEVQEFFSSSSIKVSPESFSTALKKIDLGGEVRNLEFELPQATEEKKEQTPQINYSEKYAQINYEAEAEATRQQIRNRDLIVREPQRMAPLSTRTRLHEWQEEEIRENPMLTEMKTQVPQTRERDYIAKAERREKDENLPFQQERKYKGREI
jgi:hypothetical protein